eukprot:Amastigsp_a128_60.p4 type:complete len:103 gc:universal Amastigsp_a128_60:1476-1168(-)
MAMRAAERNFIQVNLSPVGGVFATGDATTCRSTSAPSLRTSPCVEACMSPATTTISRPSRTRRQSSSSATSAACSARWRPKPILSRCDLRQHETQQLMHLSE